MYNSSCLKLVDGLRTIKDIYAERGTVGYKSTYYPGLNDPLLQIEKQVYLKLDVPQNPNSGVKRLWILFPKIHINKHLFCIFSEYGNTAAWVWDE